MNKKYVWINDYWFNYYLVYERGRIVLRKGVDYHGYVEDIGDGRIVTDSAIYAARTRATYISVERLKADYNRTLAEVVAREY